MEPDLGILCSLAAECLPADRLDGMVEGLGARQPSTQDLAVQACGFWGLSRIALEHVLTSDDHDSLRLLFQTYPVYQQISQWIWHAVYALPDGQVVRAETLSLLAELLSPPTVSNRALLRFAEMGAEQTQWITARLSVEDVGLMALDAWSVADEETRRVLVQWCPHLSAVMREPTPLTGLRLGHDLLENDDLDGWLQWEKGHTEQWLKSWVAEWMQYSYDSKIEPLRGCHILEHLRVKGLLGQIRVIHPVTPMYQNDECTLDGELAAWLALYQDDYLDPDAWVQMVNRHPLEMWKDLMGKWKDERIGLITASPFLEVDDREDVVQFLTDWLEIDTADEEALRTTLLFSDGANVFWQQCVRALGGLVSGTFRHVKDGEETVRKLLDSGLFHASISESEANTIWLWMYRQDIDLSYYRELYQLGLPAEHLDAMHLTLLDVQTVHHARNLLYWADEIGVVLPRQISTNHATVVPVLLQAGKQLTGQGYHMWLAERREYQLSNNDRLDNLTEHWTRLARGGLTDWGDVTLPTRYIQKPGRLFEVAWDVEHQLIYANLDPGPEGRGNYYLLTPLSPEATRVVIEKHPDPTEALSDAIYQHLGSDPEVVRLWDAWLRETYGSVRMMLGEYGGVYLWGVERLIGWDQREDGLQTIGPASLEEARILLSSTRRKPARGSRCGAAINPGP